MDGKLMAIPVGQLHESPTNPRKRFDEAKLKELADSIREHGVLEPIIVRERAAGGYEVVAGARRLRASKMAGRLDVLSIVRQLSDQEAIEVQFIENLQRDDLHPLEEAEGLKALHVTHGKSADDLARKFGKSPAYIYARIKLADLPPKTKTLLLEEKISLSHAILVSGIPVPELVDEAARGIAKGDHFEAPMSYKNAVDYVRRNFQCDLRQAKFDQTADQLVCGVGPCGKCPKRTGNMQTLFGAADGGDRRRADICTDPKCFDAKSQAAFNLKAAEVEASGGKVLVGKAADKAQHQSDGYVNVDGICYDDPKQRTWRKLVGEKALEKLPVVLGRATSGHEFMRVEKKHLIAAVKVSGKVAAAKKLRDADKAEDSLRQRDAARMKRHKARRALARDLLPRVVAAAANEKALRAVLMLVIDELVLHYQSIDAVWKRRELPTFTGRRISETSLEALAKLSVEDLQGLIVEIIASDSPSNSYGDCWSFSWRAACEIAGIDLKKELAAQGKAKAPEKVDGGRTKSRGVAFCLAELTANRAATFDQVKDLAWKNESLKVYPIEFGRAQSLLGIVNDARRRPAKKRASKKLAEAAS